MRVLWWEVRQGMGNYLSPLETLAELVLILAVYFDVPKSMFLLFTAAIVAGMAVLAAITGHLHRKWQQDTDARIASKAIIDDIVERVTAALKEELRKVHEDEEPEPGKDQ